MAMRVGEGLRHLSRLVPLLGALAILGSPVGVRVAEAAAAVKVKAPNKAGGKAIKAKMGKASGKDFQRRSMAARKGWAMRRMKGKATASLASKMKTDSALAASPEKQASFFNRSMAAQKGWETRRANQGMAKGPKLKAGKTKTAKTKSSAAKTARKSSKKKSTRKSQKRQARKNNKKKNRTAVAAAEEPAAHAPPEAASDVDAEAAQPDVDPDAEPGMDEPTGPSRTRKILKRVGIGVAIVGGAAIGLAGGWAVFPLIGGLTAVGGIPGTAIVGAVMGAGLGGGTASWFLIDKPAREAQQAAGGGGEVGADKLRRWAQRRQAENVMGNGPGVGMFGMNGPGLSLPGQPGNLGNNNGIGQN